ncbi:PQQ-binding-like beta-propeller repeat protein [Streptomyces sp. CA-181903]|uniref:outer membrane protein assembly factor BamB family protein n=1 Tax=Streptomyces sp. CA-181903 TaxID=3240055 RepID=UPI003D9180BC
MAHRGGIPHCPPRHPPRRNRPSRHRSLAPPATPPAPTPGAGRHLDHHRPHLTLTRRRLLGIAGGSTLGVAAAGAGGWLWWNNRKHTDTPGPSHFARPANIPARATWWTRLPNADDSRPPLVLGDLVAVRARAGLVALDARTGEKRWTASAVKTPYEFTSDGTRIYTYAPGGQKAMGLKIFTVTGTGALEIVAGPFDDLSSAALAAQPVAAADGVVYLAARKGNDPDNDHSWLFLAVDTRTGKERWRQAFRSSYLPGSTSGAAATVAGRHFVYARAGSMGDPNVLKSRDTADGRDEWSWDVPRRRLDEGFVGTGQVAADDRRVYVASTVVLAVTLSDGKRAWEFGAGRDTGSASQDSSPYGRPTVKDGVLYVAESTRGIVALAADTGTLLWETPFPDTPPTSLPPVAGRKYLYVAATDGARDRIRAVDLRSHRIAWSMDVPGRIGAPPVAHERSGRLVWTAGDYVCALPLE